MAVFRTADRAKRKAWKGYHTSAMYSAVNAYYWADPEFEGDDQREAWNAYLLDMQGFGVLPISREKFRKELAKKV